MVFEKNDWFKSEVKVKREFGPSAALEKLLRKDLKLSDQVLSEQMEAYFSQRNFLGRSLGSKALIRGLGYGNEEFQNVILGQFPLISAEKALKRK